MVGSVLAQLNFLLPSGRTIPQLFSPPPPPALPVLRFEDFVVLLSNARLEKLNLKSKHQRVTREREQQQGNISRHTPPLHSDLTFNDSFKTVTECYSKDYLGPPPRVLPFPASFILYPHPPLTLQP